MKKTYNHLRTLSSYSLSESALKIKDIVSLAKKNNMPAIALTDNNNMFGALEFSIECVLNGIQPIIGASINFLDVQIKNKISQLTFLVKNEEGYKNLIHLTSKAHISDNHIKGIYLKDLKGYTEGLYCFVGGEYNPLLLLNNNNQQTLINEYIENLQFLFNENFLFELQRIHENQLDLFENHFIEL